VVQFDFRDPKVRYWMVLEPSEVSVCLQHPGFDIDLKVIVDTATLYRVYLGRAELGGTIRAGQLTMSGPLKAATRIRPLVHLERIRPSQPPGAGAPHSRLTPLPLALLAGGGDAGHHRHVGVDDAGAVAGRRPGSWR
jgi:hypothetical protein